MPTNAKSLKHEYILWKTIHSVMIQWKCVNFSCRNVHTIQEAERALQSTFAETGTSLFTILFNCKSKNENTTNEEMEKGSTAITTIFITRWTVMKSLRMLAFICRREGRIRRNQKSFALNTLNGRRSKTKRTMPLAGTVLDIH